jgi:hypothetical protein
MLADDQWPDAVRRQREQDGRPVLTFNKLPQFVHQVANDIRQNPPGIKVSPVDDDTDPELADIYEGLIRHIEYQSNAADIYAMAGGHAVACGVGHFRITTDYAGDETFDQEIYIKRIPHPLSVIWDPESIEPDRCDAEWCIVNELVHKDTFEARWPKASPSSIDMPMSETDPEGGLFWRNDDFLRIAEYWRKKPTKKKIVQFADGSVVDVTKLSNNEIALINAQHEIINERSVSAFKVEQSLVSAVDMLEDITEWQGRYIPIIPVVGGEIPLDTKIFRYGLIRFARGAQQLYNFARTAAAESIALAPKAPLLATPEMIGPFKEQWDDHNTKQRPYLLYKPDPKAPGARPERIMPPDVPMALYQEAQLATDDMKATTGIYDASLGSRSNETSGKAILARQREGDVSTAHFVSNLNISLVHAGRILVDLIPKIYDTERAVRILGEDDTESVVKINHQVISPETGKPILVNDLSQGRYDVRLRVGPNYTTKRIESAESMLAFIQAYPPAGAVVADLVAKNQDWPGADEIAERLKRTIPPQVLGEDAEQQVDPMQQEMAKQAAALQEMAGKLTLMQQQADLEKTKAETRKSDATAKDTQVDTLIKLLQAHLQGFQPDDAAESEAPGGAPPPNGAVPSGGLADPPPALAPSGGTQFS